MKSTSKSFSVYYISYITVVTDRSKKNNKKLSVASTKKNGASFSSTFVLNVCVATQ